MEKKFNTEIEGLKVIITYNFERGDKGDYFTPPTGDFVDILYWELAKGEEKAQAENELSDDDWDAWMFDIEEYVYHQSTWDILEWENRIRDIDFGEN